MALDSGIHAGMTANFVIMRIADLASIGSQETAFYSPIINELQITKCRKQR